LREFFVETVVASSKSPFWDDADPYAFNTGGFHRCAAPIRVKNDSMDDEVAVAGVGVDVQGTPRA